MNTREAMSVAIHTLNGTGNFSESVRKLAAEKLSSGFGNQFGKRKTFPIPVSELGNDTPEEDLSPAGYP